jgi:hypothetical protein
MTCNCSSTFFFFFIHLYVLSISPTGLGFLARFQKLHTFFLLQCKSTLRVVYVLTTATPPVYSTTNSGWRKVKACWFGSAKWTWPNNFAHDAAEAGKRHNKA